MTVEARRRRQEGAGRRAEAVAAWWLRAKGFRVLATRWRAKVGEIDVVARRGDLVVFVEVKSRATAEAAASAITPLQRSRIARAAALYLARHPELAGCRQRFDAVLLAPWSRPRHVPGAWLDDDPPALTVGFRSAPGRRRGLR